MFILKWFTMWPRFYLFWCGFILRCWFVWVPWPRWPWMSMEGWPGLWFLWRSKAYLVMSVQLQALYLTAWSCCLHLGGRSWWWSSTNGTGCTLGREILEEVATRPALFDIWIYLDDLFGCTHYRPPRGMCTSLKQPTLETQCIGGDTRYEHFSREQHLTIISEYVECKIIFVVRASARWP